MRSSRLKFEIRKKRVRAKIAKTSDRMRLSVFKSGKHIYAQVIDDMQSVTVVSASTLEFRQLKRSSCNVKSAEQVGELVSSRALSAGIKVVVFDKGGYRYHGVVKALADAARKNLQF